METLILRNGKQVVLSEEEWEMLLAGYRNWVNGLFLPIALSDSVLDKLYKIDGQNNKPLASFTEG